MSFRKIALSLWSRHKCHLFLSGVLALVSPASVWAQSAARLDGVIDDPSHAVVQGAQVSLTNKETGVVTRVDSGGSGEYVFAFVLPGSYTLSVSHQGFKSWTLNPVAVHANDRLSLNVTLAVGNVTESVQVAAQAGSVPITDSGQRTETLTSAQIQAYSTIGRNADELLKILPGVVLSNGTNAAYGGQDSFDPHVVSGGAGLQGFNINGNRDDSNTYKLDGGNMNDLTGNGGNNIYPNSEFIQELTVAASNFTADQGGSPVVVTAITKSGTKDFHGEAYYSVRNDAADANDWTNNSGNVPRPPSRFNYPGFSVGGPILLPGTSYNRGGNKKLFFFFGTEWDRQLPGALTEYADVPTAKMLTGDFSDIVLSPTCVANPNGTYLQQPCNMKDPATGQTVASQGGMLTGGTSNGAGLLKSLMGPNFAGPNFTDPNGHWNFAGHPGAPVNLTQYVGRIDWDPTDKARIYVRLGRQDETDTKPWGEYAFENTGWTSNVPEPSPTIQGYNTRSMNLNMVSLLSPTMTNEFVFNVNVLRQPSAYQNPSILTKQSLGINFTGIYASDANYPIVPQIVPAFANCDSFDTSGCSGGMPEGRWGASNLVGAGNFYKETQFEFGDSLTKVVHAHTLKFGVLVGRARHDQNLSGLPLEGQLTVSNWAGNSTGDEYGDVLLEHFSQYEQSSNDVRANLRSSLFEWFGQDNWKVNRRLTLEFGARWTFQGPWYESRGLGATFDPTAYSLANSSNPFDGIRTSSCKNFNQSLVADCGTIPYTIRPYGHPLTQPRIGFSWDTMGTGKAVLRGGFGAYSQRDPTNAGYNSLLSPPNLSTTTICCGYNSLSAIESHSGSVSGAQTYGQGSAAYNPHDDHFPTIYQYNLTVSSALPSHFFAELGYVGSQTRHLLVEQNIDPVPPGALWEPGTHIVNPIYVGNERLAAPFPTFGEIIELFHNGNAHYNALQATLRRQASHNFDFLASYTYSKAEGQSDEFQYPLPNPFSGPGSYHVLSFDHTHIFNIGYQYYIPNGARGALSNSALARGALSGWMLSGITTFSTGTPLSINASVNCLQNGATCPTSLWPNTNDAWFGTNAWGFTNLPGSKRNATGVYPVFTCNPVSGNTGFNVATINTSCISLPAFGQQGSLNPPSIRTPRQATIDLALQKAFHIGETRRLEFRVSGFNLLNHPYLLPQNTLANFNWVVPVGATDPSTGQAVFTNATGACQGGVGAVGYTCIKTGHRELEGSFKFFF
jgi:hypothetical protein